MIKTYLGILLAVTTILIMTGMQASASSEPGQAEDANDNGSTGNWQTVLMADGNECEGMVFESAEEAEAAALEMGCSGYHEHHKDDGTVLYMPCALEDVDDIEDIKTLLLGELANGEITQEQLDEKLTWLEAKIR